MELAVFSSLVLAASLVASPAATPLFHGWTWLTLAPVIVQGIGGIVVGLVMKYAGGVQKGFAIMGGILLSRLEAFCHTCVRRSLLLPTSSSPAVCFSCIYSGSL